VCRPRAARGAPHLGHTQDRTRVWLEVGDDPDGRGLPGSEREKGEERGRLDSAGWAARGEKKKKGRLGWAMWEEKGRGEKERESGPG
jgi:hypothetical protein